MSVPVAKLEPFIAFVARGRPDAAAYMRFMAEAVYLADDAVDEDLTAEQRQEYMARLLWIFAVEMPRNPFHSRYAAELAPLLSDAIVQWEKSDEWRRQRDPGYTRSVFGFVRRENMDGLIVAIAGIVGGRSHAKAVAEMTIDVFHADGETVGRWLKG